MPLFRHSPVFHGRTRVARHLRNTLASLCSYGNDGADAQTGRAFHSLVHATDFDLFYLCEIGLVLSSTLLFYPL